MEKTYGHLHFWIPWLLFFVVWFLFAKLFDSAAVYAPGWWFNTAGHAVFGVWWMLSRCFLMHHPKYIPLDQYWARQVIFYAKNSPMLTVFTATSVWEIGEFAWDLLLFPIFPELDRAQKGVFDTSVDIVIANVAAHATFYMLRLGWYRAKIVFPLFQFFGISAKEPT